MTRQAVGQGQEPDWMPRTPEEREICRNLLRGMRAAERNGVFINHQWCRVRRAKRAGDPTMYIDFDTREFEDD